MITAKAQENYLTNQAADRGKIYREQSEPQIRFANLKQHYLSHITGNQAQNHKKILI